MSTLTAPLPLQGLETLGGQVQPGLPFDLGAQAANEGFSGMVRGIHERLGSAAHMPAELFNAGGGWGSCGGAQHAPAARCCTVPGMVRSRACCDAGNSVPQVVMR